MAPKPSVDEVLNTFGDVDLSVTSADGPRCFRVSSHQLKASSPFFEGRLKAIKVMEAPFHLNISLEDMPLQAVRIVLEILHGQPHGYASSLTAGDIELLYQIARVTDHFKCEERMTDWGTIWLNHPLSELMKNSIHLDKLIFISEVFQHQEGFEAATRLAILRSYTRLNSKEVFWDFRTESYSQENVMRGTFTATRSLVLKSVLEERQKLGQRLADKIILLNSYYDGYPRYMVKGPFPGQKIITHHCKLRVDACDWLICGAIRHFVYRWKLRDWEKSPCPVHDMTTDQLARGLSEIVFPKYSTGTETYHACSPSSSKIAADIKQELDSLRGLDLLAFQQ